MEACHTETGRLLASGWTQTEIETAPWWNPAEFSITDTGQTLPTWQERQASNQRWHYVAGLNQYFQSDGMFHGFFKAAKTLFTPERWEEIYDTFTEYHIPELILKGEKAKIKRMIIRARDRGLVTTEEVQLLNTIFNGA